MGLIWHRKQERDAWIEWAGDESGVVIIARYLHPTAIDQGEAFKVLVQVKGKGSAEIVVTGTLDDAKRDAENTLRDLQAL